MIISYNLWHTSWSKFLDANNEFVTIWTQLMSYLKKKKILLPFILFPTNHLLPHSLATNSVSAPTLHIQQQTERRHWQQHGGVLRQWCNVDWRWLLFDLLFVALLKLLVYKSGPIYSTLNDYNIVISVDWIP